MGTFRLHHARSFLLSPDWDGETVLYDRRAGDLWVISHPGRLLVEALAEGAPLSAAQLGVRLAQGSPAADSSDAPALMDELARQGIVERIDT